MSLYYGCIWRQNVERLLVSSDSAEVTDTSISQPTLAGTRFAAVSFNDNGKGEGGPYTITVSEWNLTNGQRTGGSPTWGRARSSS